MEPSGSNLYQAAAEGQAAAAGKPKQHGKGKNNGQGMCTGLCQGGTSAKGNNGIEADETSDNCDGLALTNFNIVSIRKFRDKEMRTKTYLKACKILKSCKGMEAAMVADALVKLLDDEETKMMRVIQKFLWEPNVCNNKAGKTWEILLGGDDNDDDPDHDDHDDHDHDDDDDNDDDPESANAKHADTNHCHGYSSPRSATVEWLRHENQMLRHENRGLQVLLSGTQGLLRLQQQPILLNIDQKPFHFRGHTTAVTQTADTQLHRPPVKAWQQQQRQQQQLQQQQQKQEQLAPDLEQSLAGFDEHAWQARQRRTGSPDSLGYFSEDYLDSDGAACEIRYRESYLCDSD